MSLNIEIAKGLFGVSREEWNALAGTDPFLSHEFLSALEISGSVGAGTGWQPFHIIAREGGALKGAMPLYAKSHSYGEYVFDHAFADAYARAGGEYYPKLLAATPFTPVSGARILARGAKKGEQTRRALLDAALGLGQNNRLSSLHINFCEDDIEAMGAGFLPRHDVQFHFENPGFESFDDFLAALSSSKRKTIRKERAQAHKSGLEFRRKSGAELTQADWDCFWACYQDTGRRKWGSPYLTRSFFEEIALSMKASIMMALAYEEGRAIASAINFIDAANAGGRLLGRYWGQLGEYRFLHFELCFYQAIEYAIEAGLARVEAGAQGPHKLARGYAPTILRSYHYFYDERFHTLIARYLEGERADQAYYRDALCEHLPFRKSGKQTGKGC